MSFGTPYLKELKKQAESLGVNVDYWRNSNNDYMVRLGEAVYEMPHNSSAACACHFIMGIIAHAKQTATIGTATRHRIKETKLSIIRILIMSDDELVGNMISFLWENNKEKRYHDKLFGCIVDWVDGGNIVNGSFLKRGREALLLHYDDVFSDIVLEKNDSGKWCPRFNK